MNKKVNKKIYRIYGIETAIDFLRPNATYELKDGIIDWKDSRPCPSVNEINETLRKMKSFEDSINTIWKKEQLKQFEEIGIVEHLPAWDHYLMYKDYYLYQKQLMLEKKKNKKRIIKKTSNTNVNIIMD